MNTLLNQENDRLRNVLLYSLLDDKIREHIGLKGVSQFFHSGEGWYFWLLQRKGVYEIEFLGREEKNSRVSIEFSLKYYPHPDEAVFADYSIFEQLMRLQYPFEQNCPTPQCRENLSPHFFYIGKINLLWYDEAVLLSVCSQNRWIEYLKQGLKIKNNEGVLQEVLGAGEKDRNIPGWDLSFDFYNCLMKAFCFAYRSAPQLISLKHSPGKVDYIDETKKVSKEAGGDIYKIRLIAVIPFSQGLSAPGKISEAAKVLPEKGEIIYQEGKKDFLHLYPNFFDKDWWRMAERGREILPEGLRV